jgi:hypothetical protein
MGSSEVKGSGVVLRGKAVAVENTPDLVKRLVGVCSLVLTVDGLLELV